ncbi:MAG: epr [Mycobacterium sp.]|nr:epr [Mycobacterium sp.]
MGRAPRHIATLLASLVAFALIAISIAFPASALTGSWSDRLADLIGAAQLAGSGNGVTVAVLDTWVDNTHPDFGDRVSVGVTCSSGSCVPGANQPDVCEPHGTHVTGIIASTRYGVAPEAKVLPIRVLTGHSGVCAAEAADVALGIQYAVAHKIRLINVSLGSTFPLADPDKVLPAAVTAATRAGALVVVAAGNGKASAIDTYGKDAFTVAALGPTGQIASYSQQGAGVDLAAPGGDAINGNCDPADCIVSTWQDGGYASDAGTSMAAPFVSGTAALLLSQDPKRTMAEVRKTITSTAKPLSGAGAGRLDILAAVRLHAPKGTTPQTGSDTNSGSIGITGVPGVAPKSITAAPGAGSAPTAASSTEAAATGSTPSSSSKIKFGPVQLLGILLVVGVGIAFVSVANTRARRQ